jgi:hypothetical protein
LTLDLESPIARIRAWGEERDWRGYDPYDALNSPFARGLTLGTPLGRRILTQAVKFSPVNLRPLLGVRPTSNAKALALVASAYARLSRASDDEAARGHARRWLGWLLDHSAPTRTGKGWGYPFDVQTRFFGYGRDTPNTIATAFVAHAFLDAGELLGARAAADFLTDSMLLREPSRTYFNYVPDEHELIHNANLLACAVVCRLDANAFREHVEAALAASLAAQRDDGSWPYAEAPGQQWADNFHTAYVLESLAHCAPSFPEVREPLQRGIAYWHDALFLEDGTPKYLPDRTYPLDAHCYATAIDTWVALADFHADALANATTIANRLIDTMLDPSGYVHFQQHRLWKSKVPYVRWTTAPTFRALAGLLLAMRTRS